MSLLLLSPLPSDLSENDFVGSYGHIYENSPWVCKAVWPEVKSGALNTCEAMQSAMKSAVDAASHDDKVQLLHEHPELGGAAAIEGNLEGASKKEQSSIGLTDSTNAKVQQLRDNNASYRQKFSFPFIIAVSGLTIDDIQRAFETRISNSKEQEFKEAITQIHRIAGFRLVTMAQIGGYIKWKKK